MRKNIVVTAAAFLMAGVLLTGCEELKEFAGDSMESIGNTVSDVADTVGETLGLNEPTQVPTQSVKPEKIYATATPKPTKSPEQIAEEEAKKEERIQKAREALEAAGQKVSATPIPTEEGKKDKKDKKDKDAKATATPTEEPENTPVPTEEPTSTPEPTKTPTPTPSSSGGGGDFDW